MKDKLIEKRDLSLFQKILTLVFLILVFAATIGIIYFDFVYAKSGWGAGIALYPLFMVIGGIMNIMNDTKNIEHKKLK